MALVRLAGCSVGCAVCDTNYKAETTETADTIAWLCDNVTPTKARDRWVWITGGEPGDWDLRPLLGALRERRFSIAVASSGHHRIIPPVDWLSISPHDPLQLKQTYGNEIKLIPGLNGLDVERFREVHPDSQTDFLYRYVQPLWQDGAEDPESLKWCLDFIQREPNWALSRQDHKYWDVP